MKKEEFIKKYALTSKEGILLEFLVKGLYESEIALIENVDVQTIFQMISTLLKKLGVDTKIKASIKAIKEGFI